MRSSSTFGASISVASLWLAAALVTPAAAKEGVKATLHTSISLMAIEGSRIDVQWSLADEKTGKPFSACEVFVRLIGPTGEWTEGFAQCDAKAAEGNYQASVTVPSGGISEMRIGVAGTTTDSKGNSKRSDWLVPLVNAPTRSRP